MLPSNAGRDTIPVGFCHAQIEHIMARFESFEWTDRGRANGVNLNGDVLSWWEAPEPSNRSVGGGQSYQDVSDFLENGPALGAPKRIVQKLLDALGAPEVEWEP